MQVEALHLEITGHCNAFCLGCVRTSDMAKEVEKPLRPAHLSKEAFLDLLESQTFSSVDFMYFCGVLGDPMAHPFILEFIQKSFFKNKNLKIQIHTNGSLGRTEDWQKMGLLSQKHNLKVTFSIDGLKNTNHLYRQGVSYERIMENATTYINNGGHAIWKWIEFSVNKEEIKEGEILAKSMGFKDFQVRDTYDSERVPGKVTLEEVKLKKYEAEPFSKHEMKDLTNRLQKSSDKKRPVSCQAKERKEIYIDSYGKVWPCCWLGNLGLERRSMAEREHFHRVVLNQYEEDFNSLQKRNLDQILAHQWFQEDLINSWSNSINEKENPCSPTCLKHCGKS